MGRKVYTYIYVCSALIFNFNMSKEFKIIFITFTFVLHKQIFIVAGTWISIDRAVCCYCTLVFAFTTENLDGDEYFTIGFSCSLFKNM